MNKALSRKNISFISKHMLAIIFISILTGCGHHYLYTESEIEFSPNRPKEPQIVKSKIYGQVAQKAHTVAIKAPDSCYGQNSLSTDRKAQYQKDVVRSNCGVEIGIIEKKLIENGYSVVSWEMLESLATTKNKSYLQCAKELDVDVLFSVNLLERMGVSDLDNSIKRSYFDSDEEGRKGAPWALGESHKRTIRDLLRNYELNLNGISLGSSIDVSAIDVKTGKSIWFYKASFYDLKQKKAKITAAFHGRKSSWRIFKLNGEPVEGGFRTSTEYDHLERATLDAYYQTYLVEAVTGFISSFKYEK